MVIGILNVLAFIYLFMFATLMTVKNGRSFVVYKMGPLLIAILNGYMALKYFWGM